MKKIFTTGLLGVSFLFTANSLSAQNFDFGVKAGGNYGFGKTEYSIFGQTSKVNYSGMGFYVGAFTEISGNSKFSGQLEVLYDYNTLKYKHESMRFGTLRIPILLKYAITPKLNVSIGPSLGFNLSKKIYDTDEKKSYDIKDEVKTFQFGALVGVSYKITESLGVDLRYNQYFSNMYDGDDTFGETKVKFNALQLGLSYKF